MCVTQTTVMSIGRRTDNKQGALIVNSLAWFVEPIPRRSPILQIDVPTQPMDVTNKRFSTSLTSRFMYRRYKRPQLDVVVYVGSIEPNSDLASEPLQRDRTPLIPMHPVVGLVTLFADFMEPVFDLCREGTGSIEIID